MAPVVLDRDSTRTLTSLDPKGDYFAIVHPGMDHFRLSVWDTHSQTARFHASLDSSDEWTCLRWARIPINHTSYQLPKDDTEMAAKKIKGDQMVDVVILGTAQGNVQLFSIQHQEMIKRFEAGHQRRVIDAFVDPVSSNILVTCSEDGQVTTWDMVSGTKNASFKATSDAVSRMTLAMCDQDGNMSVVLAGNQLYLCDISKQTVKATSPNGHASLVRQLALDASSGVAASIAEQDRFVNVWSTTKPSRAGCLSLESNAEAMDILDDQCMLVVCEDGSVSTFSNWSQALKKVKKSSTQKPVARLPDGSLVIETAKNERIPVVDCMWTQKEEVLVVYGNKMRPRFERVQLIEKHVKLVRKKDTAVLIDDQASLAKQRHAATHQNYRDNDAKVMSAADLVVTQQAKTAEDMDVEKAAPGEATIEEKLKALSVVQSATANNGTDKKVLPKADSLHQMLAQALHSSDTHLLEECLAISKQDIIYQTVQKLPTKHVIPLLSQIVSRFQAKPSRANDLAKWIRSVLVIHMGYLMTQPELLKQLMPLYQVIDARLHNFNRLLRLQGRLDVLEQQIRIRHSALRDFENADQQAALQTPMAVYDENEVWTDGESDRDEFMSEGDDDEIEFDEEMLERNAFSETEFVDEEAESEDDRMTR